MCHRQAGDFRDDRCPACDRLLGNFSPVVAARFEIVALSTECDRCAIVGCTIFIDNVEQVNAEATEWILQSENLHHADHDQ